MEVVDLLFKQFVLGLELSILNLQLVDVSLETPDPYVHILLGSLLLLSVLPSSLFVTRLIELSLAVGVLKLILKRPKILFRKDIVQLNISIQDLVELTSVVKLHIRLVELSLFYRLVEDSTRGNIKVQLVVLLGAYEQISAL